MDLPILVNSDKGRTTATVIRISNNLPSSYQALWKDKERRERLNVRLQRAFISHRVSEVSRVAEINLRFLKKRAGSGNLSSFCAEIKSGRFIMWYELKALAPSNPDNYVIHVQTRLRAVRPDRISFAGFSEKRNNIFLSWGMALMVYWGLGR